MRREKVKKMSDKKQTRQIQAVVKIVALEDSTSDFAFWQTQSYTARLAALEEIRQEYHRWRGDAQPGFQRVYRIIKR
jgi:hypothetical protein